MDFNTLLALLIGGGGVGAIVSALFTRQTSKETHRIDLLDKAYIEIARLDEKITELESKLDEKESENFDLHRLVVELRMSMATLKIELDNLKEVK